MYATPYPLPPTPYPLHPTPYTLLEPQTLKYDTVYQMQFIPDATRATH